ncbi:cytochrome c oxidase assembly protein [Corallococcus exercitus]|uniref:Cytochrome c oxidase assembly protein n=1 Tax=Corallococcus exercitus TaxID=2316736 RepID=A0A3A8IKU6_9BACT|nr:cytochrome c oxidase assembly protein [Corallococcus exercitus]NOK36047.1 cytochrome c oxidase assembly protein [Corallococcus exercitus]RKG80510.1 cytochrome c oxidase assembly protein [Corallococcus exercitus]
MRRLPCLLLALPSVAWAHGGETHHLNAHDVLRWWTWDPLVMGMLAVSGVLYVRGLRALWRHAAPGKGVRGWEAGMFALGWLTLGVALLSPLDRLSDILFSAHMTQHELLMLVAAPLLVLGRPHVTALWALPEASRAPVAQAFQGPRTRAVWRGVTGPFVVLVLHAVARWVWHVPALFEAALENDAVHAVQHLCFFGTAALFWWALLRGRYGKAGYGVGVLFVFATAAHTSILGALLTFARSVWYPLYARRAVEWGLGALEDQQLAGLIMWVPSGALFLAMGLALFAAWLGESERRADIATGESAAPRETVP